MKKYLLMAHEYHLNNGRIIPDDGESVRKRYNENDLLFDFITLLRECAQRSYLYDAEFGVIKRNYSEKIKNIIRQKRQARKETDPFFLEFANKWGLFGLIHDEAVFDYQKTDLNGDTIMLDPSDSPAYAIKTVSEPGNIDSYRKIEYDAYAKPFFPNLTGRMPFKPNHIQFITNYSEYIDSILQNPRFVSCVEYIRSIDKKNKRTFDLKNVDLTMSILNNSPTYHTIKDAPLVKRCQILLFINETKKRPQKKAKVYKEIIGICAYRRCHKPYRISERESGRYGMYCSVKCMRNANKGANR